MDPMTVQELLKQLKDTFIYRFPQSFSRVSIVAVCLFLAIEVRTEITVSRHILGGKL